MAAASPLPVTIRFDRLVDLRSATIIVRLIDATMTDIRSPTVAELRVAGLDEVTDSVTVGLPVDAALLKTGRYHLVMVRVTWGDDEPSPGDWVNTAAHPVRAGATPSPIVVPVHAIT